MPEPSDPLASALDELDGPLATRKLLIDDLFGDRPEILERIKAAKARGVSFARIAETLAKMSGRSVTDGAVRNWIHRQPK